MNSSLALPRNLNLKLKNANPNDKDVQVRKQYTVLLILYEIFLVEFKN